MIHSILWICKKLIFYKVKRKETLTGNSTIAFFGGYIRNLNLRSYTEKTRPINSSTDVAFFGYLRTWNLRSKTGKALYKKLKEAQKEESVALKHHDEILQLTKSPDHDPDDVSVLRQLDRVSMELEVVRYRVRIIQSDLELESGIQFGSGLHKAPLEEELRDLETQLENNALYEGKGMKEQLWSNRRENNVREVSLHIRLVII